MNLKKSFLEHCKDNQYEILKQQMNYYKLINEKKFTSITLQNENKIMDENRYNIYNKLHEP